MFMKLTITEFENVLTAKDHAGRKALFKNRHASCIIITLSGRIIFTFDGGYVVSEKNNPVFLPEGLTYVNECIEDAHSLVFNFHIAEKDVSPHNLSGIPESQAIEKYNSIKEADSSICPSKYARIFSELYSLIFIASKSTSAVSGTDAILQTALSYITENYADSNLTSGKIASHCYISEIYLRKIFAQKKNTTPHRVLTEIRMKTAYSLAMEKRPIKEIAKAVGYSDIYQFSRAYKKHFGYPPSKTIL